MVNLVAKELLLQKKQLLFGIAYILLFIFSFQSMGPAAASAGVVGFTYLLVMTSCAYDDKNKTDVMLNSLPIRRSSIVAAKYISVFVFLLMGMMVYVLLISIIKVVRVPVTVYPLTSEGFVGGVFAVSFLAGIYLPIFFKVGYLKSRIFNFMLFFLFFFGAQFIVTVLQENGDLAMVKGIADFFQNQGDIVIALTILTAALVLLSVSYAIALIFYKQREF